MSSNKTPQAAFHAAASQLQNGRFEAARRQFTRLAKQYPESAAVWYNLGLCEQNLGHLQPAVRAYRHSLRRRADQPEAQVNLGLAYFAQGRMADAIGQAEAALKHSPDHLRALNLLGSSHARQGDVQAAAEALNRAARLAANDPDTRHNQASLALQRGQLEDARSWLEPLASAPQVPRNHRLLWVQILLAKRELTLARSALRTLLDEQPNDPETRRLELSLLEQAHDYFGILERAPALLKIDDSAQVWNCLGNAYFQLDNNLSQARDCYQKAVQRMPKHAEYHNNLGLSHAAQGDPQTAERCYRKALALKPDYVEAYRNVIAMRRITERADADVQAIEAIARTEVPPQARMKLDFVLGKIYDDLGDYAAAFKHYAAGNRAKFAEATLDFTRYLAHIDRIEEVFQQPPAIVSDAAAPRMPIFILGMPRSGTTLIEQIICRHPQVSGCGELPCMEQAISRLERDATPQRVYPQDFTALTAAELNQETTRYLDWINRLYSGDTPFFTDKMPFNFVHVWLIRALFPQAPIIHCHRHPLDVIVSNYFQLYASDISFVYDLPTLARYYLRYHRLMRHWQAVFPGQIQRVDYERLVADEARQTRALIESAGLSWHEDCQRPAAARTAARTASIWQVRQDMYTSSTARWRHYAEPLAPAIEILQEGGVLDDAFNDTVDN